MQSYVPTTPDIKAEPFDSSEFSAGKTLISASVVLLHRFESARRFESNEARTEKQVLGF